MEGDGEAVPPIDRHDSEVEVDQLLFGEVLERTFVHGVRGGTLRDSGHGLCPFQCRLLAITEKRRFPPDGEQMKSRWIFPIRDGLLHMHVDAEGASIDLRGPQEDEMQQTRLEAALLNELGDAPHRLYRAGPVFSVIESGIHNC